MVVVVEMKVTIVVVVVIEVVEVTIVDVEGLSTTIGECVMVTVTMNPTPLTSSDYTFRITWISLRPRYRRLRA